MKLLKLFIDQKTYESQNALVLSGIVELYRALHTPLVTAKLLLVVECSFRCDRILQKHKLSCFHVTTRNFSLLYWDLIWAFLTQRMCFELSFNIAAIAKWLGSLFCRKVNGMTQSQGFCELYHVKFGVFFCHLWQAFQSLLKKGFPTVWSCHHYIWKSFVEGDVAFLPQLNVFHGFQQFTCVLIWASLHCCVS